MTKIQINNNACLLAHKNESKLKHQKVNLTFTRLKFNVYKNYFFKILINEMQTQKVFIFSIIGILKTIQNMK